MSISQKLTVTLSAVLLALALSVFSGATNAQPAEAAVSQQASLAGSENSDPLDTTSPAYLISGIAVYIAFMAFWMVSRRRRDSSTPAQRPPTQMTPAGESDSLNRLIEVVAEYGAHLQSHTAVIKGMAGASEELNQTARKQNEVLTDLAAVVKDLRNQIMPTGKNPVPADLTKAPGENGESHV